jgi:hypothetical protein
LLAIVLLDEKTARVVIGAALVIGGLPLLTGRRGVGSRGWGSFEPYSLEER